MKVIQLNEYVKLHDGENIFYCKYEYMEQACEDIRKLNHDVVLIVGGSDMCMYDHHLDILPKNVRKLFSQNCHIDKSLWGDLVQPIPRGIEVSEAINFGPYAQCSSEVEGEEKRRILFDPPSKEPNKFIYANFRVHTNPIHRRLLKEIAVKLPYMTWREPHGTSDRQRYNYGPPYIEFVNDILEHEAVLCAQGNDRGGNLRIYETLYLSRVPLTFNPKMYENLHHIFPTVLISDLSELDDYNELRKRVNAAKRKTTEARKYLDFNYWGDMILSTARKI